MSGISLDWLPVGTHWGLHIQHKPSQSAGGFVASGRKIVWHTTEGSGIDGADSALRANGAEPHFLLDSQSGRLIQYVGLRSASRSLRHPAGTPDTNRAGCIQIELVGFAAHTQNWSSLQLKRCAALVCLIEHRVKVPRRAPRMFAPGVPRVEGHAFVSASGHFGHMHVPGNDHWDPGKLPIQRIFSLCNSVAHDHGS